LPFTQSRLRISICRGHKLAKLVLTLEEIIHAFPVWHLTLPVNLSPPVRLHLKFKAAWQNQLPQDDPSLSRAPCYRDCSTTRGLQILSARHPRPTTRIGLYLTNLS
jgi:hypothetical protein